MIKRLKSFALLFLMLLTFNSSVFALLPGMKVLMADGQHKMVKDLKKGDSVFVYKVNNDEKKLEETVDVIEKIKKTSTKQLVIVRTENEIFVFGADQKVFNKKISKFVKAKDLKIEDLLYSPELGELEIKNVIIKKFKYKKDLYDIAIKDENLFLVLISEEKNILLHDSPIKVPLFVNKGGMAVMFIKTVFYAAAQKFKDVIFVSAEKSNEDGESKK
ncbi:MAG: hypothetical protein SZ59_C0002G0268 [candidate division TM6 bacterium GW2011_GWF2_28_16]|nr:MAG: hypothetical protein SZ59_C0002G0268 [candidate division TM6 bacterium GW2011_GWF2_28_16]